MKYLHAESTSHLLDKGYSRGPCKPVLNHVSYTAARWQSRAKHVRSNVSRVEAAGLGHEECGSK